MSSLRTLLVAMTLAGAGACSETPAQGFEAFYGALADGSGDAYGRLSTRAQAAFTGAARAKGQEPAAYLTSALPKSTVRRIDVVDEHGDTALLEVKDALGNVAKVAMLREQGRWRVDLSP